VRKPWLSQSRKHLLLTWLWLALLVPTALWWKDSLVWITFMSWYANFVGHWSGYDAAVAAEKIDENAQTQTP
jgi:hypothetical protein